MADTAGNAWRRGPMRVFRSELTERAPACPALHRTEPGPAKYDMHLDLEFGVVLSGAVERTFDGARLELGPGDVWFCGSWEPHGSRALEPGTTSLLYAALPTWLAAQRFPEAPRFAPIAPFTVPPSRRPRPDAATRARLLALGRVFAEIPDAAPERALRGRLELLELLLVAQTGWSGRDIAPPPQDYGSLSPAVELAQRARGPVPEEQAAAACGLPRVRFAARFARVFDATFTQFAMRCRLAGAASQLLAGDDPLKKVAIDWGFTDASHFHRTFQKHYGMTPGAYRAVDGATTGETRTA